MPMDLKYMGDCGEGIGVPVYWQNCRGGIVGGIFCAGYTGGIWYLNPRGPSIRASCPGLGVGDPKCLDP